MAYGILLRSQFCKYKFPLVKLLGIVLILNIEVNKDIWVCVCCMPWYV